MLTHFIFSLNAVMPLFLIIALGYTLKKTDFISGGFLTSGNKYVFYIALPMALFRTVYNSDASDLLDLPFIAFVMGASLASFLLLWAISAIFIKEKKILGTFVQGAFRGNFAFIGLPLLFNLAGDAGLARAAIIITFVVPMYNICSILVLAANSDTGKKVGPLTILFTVVKNPFIIGIAIGIVMVLLGIRLPAMIDRTVFYISSTATPMALICLGAGIVFQGFDKKLKYAIAASVVKVVVMPIIFIVAGYVLGFRDADLAAIMVMGGVPAAIVGYAMAVQMGGDGYIAGTLVVISILMSAVTLTLLVYFMRVMGLV